MKSTAWAALAAGFVFACSSTSSQPQLQGRTYAPPASTVSQKATFSSFDADAIRTVALRYPDPVVAKPAAPLALTASDGTGLALVKMDAQAVVDGPLAFTQLHLSFKNPRNREIEGRFRITLPPRAAISRLAMKIDGGWQEAEMVERQQARRAYEDFLHRKQDPALLEKAAGNEFRARIFPIPANGIKEIIISYSQELPKADAVYKLPLRGLPKVDDLSVTAFVGQVSAGAMAYAPTKLERKGWAPDKDFAVSLRSGIGALRHGNTIVTRVRPRLNAAVQKLGSVAILFDTSASRAPGFAGEVKRLARVVGELRKLHGDDMKLVVATFDQQVTPIFNGRAGDFSNNHVSAVLARRPLGASNLHAALTWLGKTRGFQRAILFGDGIATAGATGGDALLERARSLKGTIERLDAIAVGGIRDEPTLAKLVRGVLAKDGVVLDGAKSAGELARRVSQETVSNIKIAVTGATWVWPHRLDGVQPGDEFLVYAQVAPGTNDAALQLSGPVNASTPIKAAAVNKPLLVRSSVRAQIARLSHMRDQLGSKAKQQRDKLKQQIIDLSTKNRVLSAFTALLVLETDADYKRFKIDRNALTDILRAGPHGVHTFHRSRPVIMVRPNVPRVTTGTKNTKDVDRMDKMGKMDKKREVTGLKFSGSTSLENTYKVTAKPKPQVAVNQPTTVTTTPAPPPARVVRRPPVADPAPTSPPRSEPDAPDEAGASGSEDSNEEDADADDEKQRKAPPPLKGKLAKVMKLIAAKKVQQAVVIALRWRNAKPGDVMALVALGEALEAHGNLGLAARVYGSIIDLFPSRADMRRFAGQRLERLGKLGQSLATDSYTKAVAQRPDHLTGHRLLAYGLVRLGKYAEAFTAAEKGVKRNYPSGRFAGGKRALRDDLGMIGAAWAKHAPTKRAHIVQRLSALKLTIANRPSTRFIMTWETDANDVDFHIYDAKGGHASYNNKRLASGGELFADVTNGYGPEVFAIDGPATAGPYRVKIHYYSRGPMGYGMGRLEILKHDGKGGLRSEFRPYVVMTDSSYVNLGKVR